MGGGKNFIGTYRFSTKTIRKIDADEEPIQTCGIEDPIFERLLPAQILGNWRDEAMLAEAGSEPFELTAFREGHLTPVFFGSALRNFWRARSHRRNG